MNKSKFVKKLDEYFDNLSEAFNNPLDIKWIDKGNILRGLFSVNEHIYQIVCENKRNDIWKYDFYHYNENKEFTPELTGFEKDKFRILPTVKNGLQYLFNNKKVDCIVFGASDKSKGRKKLYDSFCEKFCEINNLQFYTRVYSDLDLGIDRQIFVLYKQDIDMEILSNTILNIIEEEKF